MNSVTSRAALSALSACLILGASSLANAAAPAAAAPAVTVAYGDLNLGTEQGSRTLYARIVAAARQVCFADDVDIRDLRGLVAARGCETHAIAQAVHDVHSPRLAAIYSAQLRHG
jgi:UrcA family protein